MLLVILGIGLYYFNENLKDKNGLIERQLMLEERKIESSAADRAQRSADTQNQIDAAHYDHVRAECVAQEKKTAQDLNDFMQTCRLSPEDCLASDAGKLYRSGLGLQAIQKCIDRRL